MGCIRERRGVTLQTRRLTLCNARPPLPCRAQRLGQGQGEGFIMEERSKGALDPSFSRLLLESMADGVFTLDEEGIITTWNPSLERISGYAAEEAVGRPCTLLNFTRCFRESCPTGIEECGIYQHGRLDARECFLRHKQGRDVPVIKSARLVRDRAGAVKGDRKSTRLNSSHYS